MGLPDELGVIIDGAIGRRILYERAENWTVEFESRIIANFNLDPEWIRACLNNGNCLRMTIIGDKKYFPATGVSAPGCSLTKRHRFSCGRRFVQHRCIGNVERRQIHDHLLEI